MYIYIYGTGKDVIIKKTEIKCKNIIKRYKKTINFDDVTKENIKQHKRTQICHKFLIIRTECY